MNTMLAKGLFVVVLLLRAASWCAGDAANDCGMDEKLERNKCVPCPQCSVGTGLTAPCGFGSGGGLTCQPCREGYYNDDPRGILCKPCTECEDYNRDYRHRCRSVVNAECGECLEGFHDDDKNLAHREQLYACKRCEKGTCHVSATSGEVTEADRKSHLSIWLPIIIMVPLVIICGLIICKRRRATFCKFCDVIAGTCLGVCLKKITQVFRPIPPRNSDEEDLYGISKDVSGTDEAQQQRGCSESQPCDASSAERSDDGVLLEEICPVGGQGASIHNNTDDEIQKSIVNKLKAIPPQSDQTDTSSPPSSTHSPAARSRESAQAVDVVERAAERSEPWLQLTSQDSLRVPNDGHSELVCSEASTLLIRADQSHSGSPNIAHGLNHHLSNPLPSTSTTSENCSSDGSIQRTKGSTREARKRNPGTKRDSESGRPSSQSPLPDRSAPSVGDLSSSATVADTPEGHPAVVLEVKARVVQYLPQAGSQQSRDIPTTREEEGVASTNITLFSDEDETCVKRPNAGRGCRPRNDQASFPSLHHFPIQETCGGVSVSGSSND